MQLRAAEEVPVYLGGPEVEADIEVAARLRLAVNDSGAHVEAAGDGGDAEPIVRAPGELGFNAGAVRADVYGNGSFQDSAKIRSQQAQRNFRAITPLESSFHVTAFGPRHKYPQLICYIVDSLAVLGLEDFCRLRFSSYMASSAWSIRSPRERGSLGSNRAAPMLKES